MSILSDGEYDQLKARAKKERDDRLKLRERIRDRIELTICSGPLNQISERMDRLTDWILNLLVSEVDHNSKIFGLTPGQILALKSDYEARTGKKAEEI